MREIRAERRWPGRAKHEPRATVERTSMRCPSRSVTATRYPDRGPTRRHETRAWRKRLLRRHSPTKPGGRVEQGRVSPICARPAIFCRRRNMQRCRFVFWLLQTSQGSEPCAERDFFSLLPSYWLPDSAPLRRVRTTDGIATADMVGRTIAGGNVHGAGAHGASTSGADTGGANIVRIRITITTAPMLRRPTTDE